MTEMVPLARALDIARDISRPRQSRSTAGKAQTVLGPMSGPRTHLTRETADGARWLACDEWFADFLRRRSDTSHRRRIQGEAFERPWDHPIRAARDYDDDTEQYRRFLRHQAMKDE